MRNNIQMIPLLSLILLLSQMSTVSQGEIVLKSILGLMDLDYEDFSYDEGQTFYNERVKQRLTYCNYIMPDGYRMSLHNLSRNEAPDYKFYSPETGLTYYFNVCRSTIQACNGEESQIAMAMNDQGQCVSSLGTFAYKVEYIDAEERERGFKVGYSYGSTCDSQGGYNMLQRQVIFEFNCDQREGLNDQDLEIASVSQEDDCLTKFILKTKHACEFLPPFQSDLSAATTLNQKQKEQDKKQSESSQKSDQKHTRSLLSSFSFLIVQILSWLVLSILFSLLVYSVFIVAGLEFSFNQDWLKLSNIQARVSHYCGRMADFIRSYIPN